MAKILTERSVRSLQKTSWNVCGGKVVLLLQGQQSLLLLLPQGQRRSVLLMMMLLLLLLPVVPDLAPEPLVVLARVDDEQSEVSGRVEVLAVLSGAPRPPAAVATVVVAAAVAEDEVVAGDDVAVAEDVLEHVIRRVGVVALTWSLSLSSSAFALGILFLWTRRTWSQDAGADWHLQPGVVALLLRERHLDRQVPFQRMRLLVTDC